MKTITLKLTHYKVYGFADLTLWSGGHGCIEMKPIKILQKSVLNDDLLIQNLNDNGFGCQSINGAIVNMYECYGTHEVYMDSKKVGKVSDYTKECFDNQF